MEHGNSEYSPRQGLALLLALTALVAAPLAIAAPATAAPSLVSAQAVPSPQAEATTETPADAAIRTSTTLASVALGTVALVVLWWYLVARRRGRD